MYSDLSLKPCPFCHCRNYIRARGSWEINLCAKPDASRGMTRHHPMVEIFVCRDCGRTQLFFDEPEKTFQSAVQDPEIDADYVDVEDHHPYRDPG